MISAWARSNYNPAHTNATPFVSHTRRESTSITKFIEKNWNLGNMGQRDVTDDDLSDMFDYTRASPVPPFSERYTEPADSQNPLQLGGAPIATITSSTTIASVELNGLRLAVLAAISWPAPPPGYGPWEQIAFNVADGMRRRGLDVTLFATGDSHFEGKLVSVVPVGLNEDPALNGDVFSALHIGELFRRAREFDLIHNHFDWKPLTYALASEQPPMLTTIHGFSSPQILAAYYAGARRSFYCFDLERRSRSGARLSRDDLQRHRSRRSLRSAIGRATISAFSGGSIPRRARISRSRSPSAPACG